MRITFHPNRAEIRRLFEDRNGPTGRAVFNAANTTVKRIRENINRAGRVKTGKMRDKISVGRAKIGRGKFTAEIRLPMPYTRFQDKGTRYIEAANFTEKAMDALRASDFR